VLRFEKVTADYKAVSFFSEHGVEVRNEYNVSVLPPIEREYKI